MDRSVFLSDIDGTLVRGDVLPAPEVVQAADVFRAAGGLLSLCTGRSVEGARPVAESLSVDTPCVLYGGAALYDFSADRFLWSVPFSPHILDCMERFLREFPHLSLQVLTEQGSFVLRRNALLNAKGVRVENQGPEVPLSALPIPILKLVLCGENREELENCPAVFPARAVLLHLLQPSLCGRGVRGDRQGPRHGRAGRTAGNPPLPVSVRRRWNERFAHAKTGRRCLRPGQRTGEGAGRRRLGYSGSGFRGNGYGFPARGPLDSRNDATYINHENLERSVIMKNILCFGDPTPGL